MLNYSSDLMMRTLGGEVTSQKPVWIMRQAGRYLSEYREVRSRYARFMDFCADAEACREVTLQPLRRFQLDAAILFSDILTLLPPLGARLEFVKGEGPVIDNPVRSLEDAERLFKVNAKEDLAYVYRAVKLIHQALDGRIPLLGFAGGPLTVASYLIEGGSSKELAEVKRLAFGSPEAFHLTMSTITDLTIEYLQLQVEAGADALVLMDSWAGYFAPEDYQQLVFPYTQKIFAALKGFGVPTLHYANGASHLLPHFAELPATALGLDWRVDLDLALEKYPKHIFQGNLDPTALFAPEKVVESKTRALLAKVQNRPHIMNLGHGVLPSTPVEGVEAFLRAIRTPN